VERFTLEAFTPRDERLEAVSTRPSATMGLTALIVEAEGLKLRR